MLLNAHLWQKVVGGWRGVAYSAYTATLHSFLPTAVSVTSIFHSARGLPSIFGGLYLHANSTSLSYILCSTIFSSTTLMIYPKITPNHSEIIWMRNFKISRNFSIRNRSQKIKWGIIKKSMWERIANEYLKWALGLGERVTKVLDFYYDINPLLFYIALGRLVMFCYMYAKSVSRE